MRIARAVAELSLDFPRLSDEPLEQFLVEEAVMTRYQIERERAEADQARLRDAADAGQRLLEQHLRSRGGDG